MEDLIQFAFDTKDIPISLRLHEAILTCHSLQLSPKQEIRLRSNLASLLFKFTENIVEAETHLNKAMLLAQQSNASWVIRFELSYLLSSILLSTNPSSAKALLKQSSSDALELEMYAWYYQFAMRRIRSAKQSNESTSTLLNGCIEISKKMRHQSMTLLCSLTQAEIAIQNGKVGIAEIQLEQVATVNDKSSIHPIVQIYALIIQMTFRYLVGDSKATHSHLTDLQVLIETPQLSETIISQFESGQYMIPVSENEFFKFIWLSKIQLVSFVYYLSGCMHLNKDPSKSRKFILEGIKSIDNHLEGIKHEMISVIDKQELDMWYHKLKVEMMKIHVYVCIIRNEITEAKRNFGILTDSITSVSINLHQKIDVLFIAAILEHTSSNLILAKQYYSETIKFIEHYKLSHSRRSIISACHLHLFFISILLEEYENAEINHLSPLLPEKENSHCIQDNMIHHLAQACKSAQDGQIQTQKQHLLDALNASETVGHMASKTVTLIMLGKVFELTEPQYSQKILSTALTIAKKMKHARFIQLCSLMLTEKKQSA